MGIRSYGLVSLLFLFMCACLAVDAGSFDPAAVVRSGMLGDAAFRHAGTITHVVPLPDGERVLTSARDGTARLWDLATGRELRRFYHPKGEDIWTVVLHPGGREIMTAGSHGAVTRWSLDSGERLKDYAHPDGTVFRVAIHPDADRIAAVDSKKRCIVWSIASGEQLATVATHDGSVYTALFSPDGKQLTTGGSDDTVRIWDVEEGMQSSSFSEGTGNIFTLVPHPGGQGILICCEKSGPRVWEYGSAEQRWQGGLTEEVQCGAWSPDTAGVAALCDDGKLYLLNGEDGSVRWSKSLAGRVHYGVAFANDGQEILFGYDHLLARADVTAGELVFPPPGAPMHGGAVGSAVLCLDGRRLVYTVHGKGLHVFDLENNKLESTWLGEHEISCLAVSPGGNLLLAGGENVARVLDAATGGTVREVSHGDDVEAVAFSHDGEFIFTGGDDAVVVSWRVSDGKRQRVFSGHDGDMKAIAADPDGMRIATLASDHTIRAWSVKTGEEVATIGSGVENLQECNIIAADGRSISAYGGSTLHAWLYPTREELDATRDEILALIEQLAARRFREREDATLRLIEAGSSAVNVAATITSDDPEVQERLKRVREAVVGGDVECTHITLDLERTVSDFEFHADGRHWVAIEGVDASAALLVGELRDGELKILRRIEDGNSPLQIVFRPDGGFYTGNRNGTISSYSVEGSVQ